MALRLFLGGAGSGKSTQMYKRIINESIANPTTNYVILVPEQYTLSTQYKLVSMHPKKGILNIDILSFERLAYRIFEEVGYLNAQGVVLDDIGKNLLLRHIAKMHEDELTSLGGISGKLGYISEVKSVISEFMQYGIGENEVKELIKQSAGKGQLNSKLTDLAFLYGEFLTYIKNKYVTAEEVLSKVSNVVHLSDKIKHSVIVLDGYTGFTPVQYDLLTRLIDNSQDVYASILLDVRSQKTTAEIIGEPEENELFYLSKKTLVKLQQIADELRINEREIVRIDDDIPIRFGFVAEENHKNEIPKMLVHLERNLFRECEKAYCDEATGDIRIFCGTNPDDEAMEAAVRICELMRNKNYRYSDIAVVSGDIAIYEGAISRAFSRYDLPFFIDKTRPVLLNPLIEFIRATIEVVVSDFSYESVFKFLRSNMLDIECDDIDELENYVLKHGVSGKKKWSQPFVMRGTTEEDKLSGLNRTREIVFDAFGTLLSELGDCTANHVEIYASAIYNFLISHNADKCMADYELHFKTIGDDARAKEFEKIFDEVIILLEKMVELLDGEEISFEEFGELMDAGFAEIRTGVVPRTNDYIQVGDITRTRLRDVRALFFVGVNDGIIPSRNNGGGIISDMEREFLKDNDKGIELKPTVRMQAFTERLYLYMLMAKPSEVLYLSYSLMSDEYESIAPSYLIKQVRRMFPKLKEEKGTGQLSTRVFNRKSARFELSRHLQENLTKQDVLYNGLLSEARRISDDASIFEVFHNNVVSSVTTKEDSIGKTVANILFGKEIECSVTRLETYAKCAFSHFVKYGLQLKEREIMSFEAKDIGSVFHDSLQKYALLLKERGRNWTDVTEEEKKELIEEAITRCINSGEYDAIYGSFRTKYMFNRMNRILKRTVDTLSIQLQKGRFVPYAYEFGFYSTDDYTTLNIKLSDEERIRLRGRIDRVDLCEDDGNVYVKIIDYKSGNKKFDLAAIYEGLDLQLVVYLNAAKEALEKRERESGLNREVVPAGILYYHIDDPLIDADEVKNDDDINAKIISKLKMQGLINSERSVISLMDEEMTDSSQVIPVRFGKNGEFARGSSVASKEQFEIMSEYVVEKIATMGKEIMDGRIDVNPKLDSNMKPMACKYCDYSNICGFKTVVSDDADDATDDYSKCSYEELFQKMKDSK